MMVGKEGKEGKREWAFYKRRADIHSRNRATERLRLVITRWNERDAVCWICMCISYWTLV